MTIAMKIWGVWAAMKNPYIPLPDNDLSFSIWVLTLCRIFDHWVKLSTSFWVPVYNHRPLPYFQLPRKQALTPSFDVKESAAVIKIVDVDAVS